MAFGSTNPQIRVLISLGWLFLAASFPCLAGEATSIGDFLWEADTQSDEGIMLPHPGWDDMPERHLWLRPFQVYEIDAPAPLYTVVTEGGSWSMDTTIIQDGGKIKVSIVRGPAGEDLWFKTDYHFRVGFYTDISSQDTVRWYYVLAIQPNGDPNRWGWICGSDLVGQALRMTSSDCEPSEQALRRLYNITLGALKDDLQSPAYLQEYSEYRIAEYHDSLVNYLDSNLISVRIFLDATDRFGKTTKMIHEQRYKQGYWPWDDLDVPLLVPDTE